MKICALTNKFLPCQSTHGLRRGSRFLTCAGLGVRLSCANDKQWAGYGGKQTVGICETGSRRSRALGGASRAFLPELFGSIDGEPVQAELSEMWVLLELLRFLLKTFVEPQMFRPEVRLTPFAICVYNGYALNLLVIILNL